MAKRESPEPGTLGARVLEIRESWGMDVAQFAVKLNEIARDLGHEQTWSASKVSRATNNKIERVKLDEAIDLATADKQGRRLDWLVFGGTVASQALAVAPQRLEGVQNQARAEWPKADPSRRDELRNGVYEAINSFLDAVQWDVDREAFKLVIMASIEGSPRAKAQKGPKAEDVKTTAAKKRA